MHGIGRGGVEVGGILLGTRLGDLIRVVDWRPIACSHSRGPSFLLSGEERDTLRQQLEDLTEEAASRDLQIVGWFVSHTRSDFIPSEEEQSIHAEFFSSSWKALLVLVPSRYGDVEATVHLPKSEAGELQARQATLTLTPLPISAKSTKPGSTDDSGEVEFDGLRDPLSSAPAGSSRSNIWLGALVAILVLGAIGIVLYGIRPGAIALPAAQSSAKRPIESLSLHGSDSSRSFLLTWNPDALSARQADRGNIEVIDGDLSQARPLTKRELEAGQFRVTRRNPTFRVTLTTYKADQILARERIRFTYR